MAKRWVALLRGINVGGHSTVPMAGLKQLFEDAGFESVRTYINSGNVVFDGAAKPEAAALEASVQKTFGVAAAVVVRSAAELAKVAGSHPFGDDTSNSFVAFLAERPDRGAARRLRELDAGEDGYVLKAKELYVRYPNGQRNAKLTAARLERALGVPATMRNWNTVTKLVELSCGE